MWCTGEVVLSRRLPRPLTMVQWCSVFLKGRRPAYEIAMAYSNQVGACRRKRRGSPRIGASSLLHPQAECACVCVCV
jgi:hypothetical protein